MASKAHAIMIALPYQGHITPLINLATKLASKGFVITFVHLEFIHQMMLSQSRDNTIQPDLFSGARESGLDIRYETISDGFPLEFDRALHTDEYWESMLSDFPHRVDELVTEIIRANPCSAHFLVTDTLYTWPAEIAKKHNLVNVSFWTEPALVFSLAYHIDLLTENGHFPCKDHVEEEIKYLPGIESISTKDLMPYLKESAIGTTVHKIETRAFQQVKKADFILHNTVQEFESSTLSALNKHQPNYAIGPVNFSKNLGTNYAVSNSLWSEHDCTHWLEHKPPGSVLYISFGSLVEISKQLVEEIAYGLLLSEVDFIWVVRGDSFDSLMDNLRVESKEKGLIIPWCDQIRVLSDPAIGGFFTHCGWNSILESMWCGVPMICYPLEYDQPTNRKLVVDDWKIGISLCDYGISVDRKEVAKKIKKVMSGDLKHEVKKVNRILVDALDAVGSSERNFDQFTKDLRAKLFVSE
ncbi:hypothetical protein ABFS82_10G093100 [Erythranthe guttata]|uniref:Glycosyltransferase n=1 Tax=Erythranthe guttata TaxID=4155 RepID=A0A022R3H6_ERYGU|nr:PREDICTED: UDP-glycosyltransferase 86A1-like [Erythranthe guttata]EYU34489.1 hypothetical protein MIMGU_mgv1a005852mg [Erythranthe guttata]|eukprot:XP_012840956.1 PREDICTED: UDP-glycosyltransferase 86A1-like [Erythranthe guttata]